MTNKERESIVILTKFLSICKKDTTRFSVMRNYLYHKISEMIDSKINKQVNLLKS